MSKIQKYDIYQKYNSLAIVFLLLTIWHSQSNAAVQSLKSIEKKVYQFVSESYKEGKATIHVQTIDSRLKLHNCHDDLLINWHNKAQTGRNLIKVHCNSQKQWKIYVPVTLEVFKTVYVAKTDIRKGETVNSLNTIRKRLDVGKLHRGYIQNITPYDETKTRRNIKKGEALNRHLFEIQHTVKRGQQVILETGNTAINIKTKGTALSNGQKGDLIKVKNNSSSIIVEAIIKDNGKAIVVY